MPKSAVPQGNYLPYVLIGDQLVISGQGPRRQGRLRRVGRVGDDVTLDEARREAEICALNVLSQAAAALSGDLGLIVQTIKVNGFISTSATFTQHTAVIDAASSVLTAILGERGHHARTAVGVASLPSGMAVEIDATFKVRTHQHVSTPRPSKARHDDTEQVDARPRRVAFATMIGTTIEWYDFYLYGVAAALIFGPQFFPSLSTTAGTLASFATFAAGFIARPVGAVLFGYFGDRSGRKNVLVWSLVLTGLGTVAIGLLPTESSIGTFAPALLVTLRLVQGVGVGGEWSGAVIMAGEHAPADKKGEYAGWPQLGSGLGLLLANGAFLGTQLLVGPASFSAWGWRVPFLLSAVMIAVGLFIRLRLEESPEFSVAKATRRARRNPLKDALVNHPKTILLVAGTFCFNNTAFFVVNTFGLSYLENTVGVASEVGLGAVLGGAVLLCLGTLYLSKLSDTIDARTIIIATYAAWIPFAFILFGLLRTGSTPLIYIGIMTGMLLISFYGPLAGFLQRQFDTEVRYSGLGLAVQFGAILGGGAGPLIATQLNAVVGVWGVATYVAVVAVIGIGCTFALKSAPAAHADAMPAPRASDPSNRLSRSQPKTGETP